MYFRLIAILAVSLALCQSAWALPIARLRNVRPTTQVRSTPKSVFVVARERNALQFGSGVRTLKNGKAEVLFSNGTRITLRQNSQIDIVAVERGTQPLVVRVVGALSEVFVRPQGNTQIVTSAAIAAARGTAFVVRLPDENTTELIVTEDSVDFFNPQGRVLVNANESSVARVGQAPTPPVAVDVSGLTQWTADVAGLPVEYELPVATRTDRENQAPFAARLEASVAARGRGDATAALAEARAALAVADNDARRDQARAAIALSHLSAGEASQATEALTNATGTHALAVRGLLQLRSGDAAQAIETLQNALTQDDGNASAKALLALAFLQSDRVADSIATARAAASAAPRSALAQSALALALFFSPDARERNRALAVAQTATQMEPEAPLALLVQGRALIQRNRLDEAKNTLQRARALAPGLPLLDLELGNVYLRLDQNPRAEAAFGRVLAKRQDDPDALAGLGLALARQGRTEAARERYLRALEVAPRNANARANYALLLTEQGQLKQAEALLQGGLGEGPGSGLAYIRLAETLLFRQKVVEAGDAARRAVELLPDSALARYQLGRVYFEQERTVQAEQAFRQAVTLDPEFAEARFALGQARARVEAGLDVLRPLATISGANASSSARGLDVQNIQTPGFNERIQAAIQDPTVVRTASRSFGDLQTEVLVGEQGTREYAASFASEIHDRRGAVSFIAEQRSNDGIRDNADSKKERIGFSYGRKAQNNPSALFFLAQTENREAGGDIFEVSDPVRATLREESETPYALLGVNLQTNQRRRTRALVHFDRPLGQSRLDGAESEVRLRSAHAEIRHDERLGERHLLSVGASSGRRRFEIDSTFFGLFPGDPALVSSVERYYRFSELYVRDRWDISNRLSLTGEFKVQRLSTEANDVFTTDPPDPFFPPFLSESKTSNTQNLPGFIIAYQPNARSGLRFRSRQIFGAIEDFSLLAPTDVFLFSQDETPTLFLSGEGRTHELEYDYTFRDSSFLRIGLFQQTLRPAQSPGGEFLTRARFRGLRLRYEGVLNRTTTFFVNGDFNDARGVVDSTPPSNVEQKLSETPRFAAEFGLQYLDSAGWFVQPSAAYIGPRYRAIGDPEPSGGFGIANVRAGKRFGLRTTAFAEVVNIFDRSFSVPFSNERLPQPGRQFRVGLVNRF